MARDHGGGWPGSISGRSTGVGPFAERQRREGGGCVAVAYRGLSMAHKKFCFIDTANTLFLNQQVACEYKRGIRVAQVDASNPAWGKLHSQQWQCSSKINVRLFIVATPIDHADSGKRCCRFFPICRR